MRPGVKRRKALTKEQIEFRNKILGSGSKVRVEKIFPTPEVITRNRYMNNCMFWINEFEAGRTYGQWLMHKDRDDAPDDKQTTIDNLFNDK